MSTIVLLYHKVTPDGPTAEADPMRITVEYGKFAEQMRYLTERTSVVSLAVAMRQRNPGGTTDRPLVAITFDDAYADTLARVAPLFQRMSIPATIFVPPANIDEGEPYWWDALYYNERRRTPPIPVDDEQANVAAIATLGKRLMHDRYRDARWAVESYCPGAFRCVPARVDRPATWPELRALDPNLFSFGLHGFWHDCFSAMSVAALRDDLRRSLRRIQEEELPMLSAIAYPFGFRSCVTPDQIREAVALYFECGFSSMAGRLWEGGGTNQFLLPRCYVENWDSTEFGARLDALLRGAASTGTQALA